MRTSIKSGKDIYMVVCNIKKIKSTLKSKIDVKKSLTLYESLHFSLLEFNH